MGGQQKMSKCRTVQLSINKETSLLISEIVPWSRIWYRRWYTCIGASIRFIFKSKLWIAIEIFDWNHLNTEPKISAEIIGIRIHSNRSADKWVGKLFMKGSSSLYYYSFVLKLVPFEFCLSMVFVWSYGMSRVSYKRRYWCIVVGG